MGDLLLASRGTEEGLRVLALVSQVASIKIINMPCATFWVACPWPLQLHMQATEEPKSGYWAISPVFPAHGLEP